MVEADLMDRSGDMADRNGCCILDGLEGVGPVSILLPLPKRTPLEGEREMVEAEEILRGEGWRIRCSGGAHGSSSSSSTSGVSEK